MPAPSINPTTSLLAFVAGKYYEVQLSLEPDSDPATGWEVLSGGLPPGLELDETTGKISGTPTGAAQGSVWSAVIVASNADGDSAGLEITMGIERAPSQPDGTAELAIDLITGAVSTPNGETDQKGRAVLWVKRGDKFPLTIRYHKAGVAVELPAYLIDAHLKEFEPERNHLISTGQMVESGDETEPRITIMIDLTAAVFARILADYENDEATFFDALVEIETHFFHDMGGEEPEEVVRSTRPFVFRFHRDLNFND